MLRLASYDDGRIDDEAHATLIFLAAGADIL
jgi:hypothetical protein